ncbi:NAD-dependent epimerase/dehydratase family protein [Hyphobacterium marinum]|uniref:NAD(P)-dependent oxidoreductase n=1 Tax=Hyphobacterium marinum TaxID=3116574 RepID=A0ABU7LY50_9PROT|nr:NAD(P)-dependent oxidoreductase [Hyphobacterium sp. Y6023]MEE2566479.1 NAD(P)-dependent oxidoreductase [Hyphobacterium sp. Y6023]
MRILLTGATGYLGGWIRAALARDHDVVCTVRPGSQLPDGGPSVTWDLAGPLPADMPEVDAIVHAAQSRHYTAFPDGAADAFAVNVASTASLLDHAAENRVQRFCFISSGSVYEPYEGKLGEDAALAPTSLNGTTKLAAEILTRAYETLFAVSRLRLFFPYGPGQTGRMVPGLIDRVQTGQPVTLAGENGLEFAPLYAGDIANIVTSAVAEDWRGTFNVEGPEATNLRTFAEAIGTLTGRDVAFEINPVASPRILASSDRLKSRFDVETMTKVRDGLKQTLGGQGTV